MGNLDTFKISQSYPASNVHRHVLPLMGKADEVFVILEYRTPELSDLWPEELLQKPLPKRA